MAYQKTNWINQIVTRPKTYDFIHNADGTITLQDSFGIVTEIGTDVDADKLNNIENGLGSVAVWLYETTKTYALGDFVLAYVNNELLLGKSLIDKNTNNPLTTGSAWKVYNISTLEDVTARINQLETRLNNYFPDYSRTSGISSGYVTTKNGFVAGYSYLDNGYSYITFNYKGVAKQFTIGRQSDSGECGTNFFYPVAKDTTITWRKTGNNSISGVVFIPIIGE